MPELPEVETVRRGLAPWLEGARIEQVTLNRADLRFPFPPAFADRLTGRTIMHLGRRAKYLVFALSDRSTWIAHLGMTGTFAIAQTEIGVGARYHDPGATPKHTHFEARLVHPEHGALALAYKDARRFGFMDLFAEGAPNPYLDPLGPEPTGNAVNAHELAARFAGKKSPIKAVLLDQRVIAGLGNIYVCEALFRAGIAPQRLARDLVTADGHPSAALEALVGAIRTVLAEAIAAGGSSLRDFFGASGDTGYFQHSFAVYDHEGDPCPRPGCGGTISRIVQSGRSSFFCPVCQY